MRKHVKLREVVRAMERGEAEACDTMRRLRVIQLVCQVLTHRLLGLLELGPWGSVGHGFQHVLTAGLSCHLCLFIPPTIPCASYRPGQDRLLEPPGPSALSRGAQVGK